MPCRLRQTAIALAAVAIVMSCPSRGSYGAPSAPPIPAAVRMIVGAGWGCAQVVSDGLLEWECWQSAARGGARDDRPAALRAFRVPWLHGLPQAGADRVCVLEGSGFHCWGPPEAGLPPRELSGAETWINARRLAGAPFADNDDPRQAFVGGTFSCLHGDGVWCVGDGRYGQLGFGPPALGRSRPVSLSSLTSLALGTWHACATQLEVTGSDSLHCWGRNDGGQLGAPSPDVCRVGDVAVPCALKPVKLPFRAGKTADSPAFGSDRGVRAGDLFTCSLRGTEISCWGSSRDGIFGDAALCSAGLRRSWPTPIGSVDAPNATCSPGPVVVPGTERPGRAPIDFEVGPRGLCALTEQKSIWCRGAIRTPRMLAPARAVAVSSGTDASACALTGGRVICWGDGYSPVGAPDRPVAVTFEPLPPPANPNPVAVDLPAREPGKPWPASCLVHRMCGVVARKLAPCAGGTGARPWTEIAAAPDRVVGTRVSVRGPLVLGPVFHAGVLCTEQDGKTGKPMPVCCPDKSTEDAQVFIGDSTGRLGIPGHRCVGDPSRLCCNVDSLGRAVVATGRLEAVTGRDPLIGLAQWKLAGDVALCLDVESHAADNR
jgi:hypothetical protein